MAILTIKEAIQKAAIASKNYTDTIAASKVTAIPGKGLSDNNLSSAMIAKYEEAYSHVSAPHLQLGSTQTTAFRGDHGLTAYNHSQASHAPANAQKNSDITKAEIEAKLTGTITTHSHSSTPSADKVANTLKVQLNGGAIEGTNQFTYDGSVAKTVNITPSGIGAAKAEHGTHLTLGTGSGNAYRGDYGNTAYQHSQAAHAPSNAEVNQNAFSNVAVNGQTTVSADTATDTLTLVAGTNVTITTDADSDSVTITAKDTTYSNATTSANGLMSKDDKSKLNGIASGAEVNQNAFAKVTVGETTIVADAKQDTLTIVAGSNVTITPDSTNDKITIASTDTWRGIQNNLTSTSADQSLSAAQGKVLKELIDGKADSEHGTHVTYGGSTSALVSGGTGSAGSSTSVSRADHTHTLPAYPTALKSPESIKIQLNGGTTEGTNQFTYDGSAAKTISVTPANIGASPSGHTHDDRYYTESEVNTKISDAISTAQTNATSAANSYTDTAIGNLIDGAPDALNTLNELAAALGDNADYAASITNLLANKVDKVSGKALSTNDFTNTYKSKLDGIASNAEVNQNAFSNFKVGDTTVAADTKTDTVEFVAGNNITITPDSTNDIITIAAKDTTYSVATTSANGLMSSSDKSKLDGIEANANNYSHPTTAGNKHIPTGGSSGQFLAYDSSGTAKWVSNPNTDYRVKTSEAQTTKLYLTGATGAATGELKYDSAVFLDTTAGHLTATQFNGALNGNASSATTAAACSGNSATATTASKVSKSLTIKLKSGTTEGTDLFAFNGSSAKTIDITPAAIGAAEASHGTHVTYATVAGKAAGTAAVGTSDKVAREDHVHPLQTTVSGNAGSATKLKTARDITIGNKTNSFNGSSSITFTLTDIGIEQITDTEINALMDEVFGTQS